MSDTPTHQLPGEECRRMSRSHTYWSNAAALTEAREHDRHVLAAGGPVYASGARTAEAAYVDQWIGR